MGHDHRSELEAAYRARSAGFQAVLATVIGSYDEARDVVQDAFAVALRDLASFRGDGPLEAGVMRIARIVYADGAHDDLALRDGWFMYRVGGYGIATNTRPGPLRRIPVRWQLGLRNDGRRPVGYGYAYAFGWVDPKVAQLSVRFQGGAAEEIPLHERYLLWSVAPAHWPAGHRPSILVARNASGSVIYRQFLYPRQHCMSPGRDAQCRNYGRGTG